MKIISNVGDPNLAKTYLLIAREMERMGHQTVFVTISGRFEKEMGGKGFEVINIEKKVNLQAGELKKTREYSNLERQYGPEKLKRIYEMDMALLGSALYDMDMGRLEKRNERLEQKTLCYMLVWEQIIREHRPSLLLSLDGTSIFDTTALEVAARHRLPMLFTNGIGPQMGTSYWDDTNMLNNWVDNSLLAKAPTAAQRTKADEYIGMLKSKRSVHGGVAPKAITLNNAVKLLRYAWNYAFLEQFGAYHNPVGLIKPKIKKQLSLLRLKFAKFYSQKSLGELAGQKYVYFPLQYIDDAQVWARAPRYREQQKVAVEIARALPAGVKLLVKDHPHAVGTYPLRWYDEMKREPNIELLPAAISSHDLIENALAVVTINSTAGWEALMYFKPVVVLGRPFYANKGATFDVGESGAGLKSKITQAINAGSVPKEKVVRLVSAVLGSLSPCSFYSKGHIYFEGNRSYDYSQENIRLLATSCLQTYHRIWGKDSKQAN